MTGVELAIAAFTAANAVRALAYLPQIARIAQDKGDAGAVSCATWSLFAISHLATVVYALVVVADLVMAVVFAINMLACVTIVGLTSWKRHRARTRSHEQSPMRWLLPAE